MPLSTLRCPHCRSLDVTVTGAAALCNACGKASKQVDGALVAEGGRSPYLPVLAVAVAAAVGVAWWGSRETSVTDAPSAPTEPTAADAPSVVVPTGPAAATLTDVRDGPAGESHFWLATYTNSGGEPIREPAVHVRLLDAAGAVLTELSGDVVRAELKPGESAPVFVVGSDLPAYAKAEVVAAPLVKAEGEPWKQPLTVAGLADKQLALGATIVAGQLTNPHPKRARFIDVHVVGVDKAGHPVAWASGLSAIPDLAPGATAGFQVRFGAFVLEPPDHYVAWAQANLK